MLDGPDIQERYMYLWTEWSGAQRLENFLSQKVKKNRSFFGKNVNSVITKSQNLSPSWNKTLDFTSSHSNLNKRFNIILPPTYISLKWATVSFSIKTVSLWEASGLYLLKYRN